jgi:hypothetical protein
MNNGYESSSSTKRGEFLLSLHFLHYTSPLFVLGLTDFVTLNSDIHEEKVLYYPALHDIRLSVALFDGSQSFAHLPCR